MKEVTMYRTADSKVFPTEQQAERHETDLLCEKIDGLFREFFNNGHMPSTHKAILRMEANRPLARAMLAEILHVIDFTGQE